MKQFSLWTATLAWAILIFYLTTIPDFHPSDNSVISILLSNGGHLFFFGILACLIPISPLWSLTATTFYGLLIELIQRTIPGRSFSLLDLGLDTLGAIFFLYMFKKLKFKI